MKRIFLVVLLSLMGAQAFTQSRAPTQTLTGNSQCATIQIPSGTASTVVVQVGPTTFSGTLKPQVIVNRGAAANVQVTPSTSSTAQSAITANGVYYANAGPGDTFQVCFTLYSSGTATINLTSGTGVNAPLLGSSGGGGSGTILSGSGYALPAYVSGAGTTVGPSNITTDSTGNNLNVPGAATPKSLGGVLYVNGPNDPNWSSGCTNDDGCELLNVIAAVSSGSNIGTRIVFAPGSYSWVTTVLVNVNNIWLDCPGGSEPTPTVIFKAASGGTVASSGVMLSVNKSGSFISSFKMTGCDFNGNSIATTGVQLLSVSQSDVEDIQISSFVAPSTLPATTGGLYLGVNATLNGGGMVTFLRNNVHTSSANAIACFITDSTSGSSTGQVRDTFENNICSSTGTSSGSGTQAEALRLEGVLRGFVFLNQEVLETVTSGTGVNGIGVHVACSATSGKGPSSTTFVSLSNFGGTGTAVQQDNTNCGSGNYPSNSTFLGWTLSDGLPVPSTSVIEYGTATIQATDYPGDTNYGKIGTYTFSDSGSGGASVLASYCPYSGNCTLPVLAIGSFPSCTATNAGSGSSKIVADNCNASCSAGGSCTAGGTTACEMYCQGSSTSWKETGLTE